MSNIEELIEQLCPDGVEFKELQEVFDIKNGYTPSKANVDYWENGSIPWFRLEDIRTNGRILSDSIQYITPKAVKSSGLFPANSIIVATTATIGEHALLTVKSLANQQFTYLSRKDLYLESLNIKFFFYYMFIIDEWCKKNVNSGGFAIVDMSSLKKLKIPHPPLPIQQKIVTILDKFTQLQVELESELQARRTQYEYYRNELLNFEGKEVEWKTLGEVSQKTDNIKWKENQNTDFQYIDLSSVSRENNKISEVQTINSTNAPSRAQQIINKDDVIFGTTRPTLKRYTLITSKYHNQICSTGFCVLRANQEELLPKFLFFILTTTGFYNYVDSNQEGAGYPSISNSVVKKFKIPIPPIAEQNRIVAILDKFDKLVNDKMEGLPAEIESRRKQYEYYRGKLLDFKSLAQ